MLAFSQLIAELGSELKGSLLESSFGLSTIELEEDLEEGQIICGSSAAKQHGIEVSCQESIIKTIFLYGQSIHGFESYLGALPSGLCFSAAPDTVRSVLGKPTKCGPPLSDSILGSYGPWDRYDFTDYCLHFQYAIGGDNIAMVTLMHGHPASIS